MDKSVIISILFDLFVFWLAFFFGYVYGTKKEFERTINTIQKLMYELENFAKDKEKK